MTAANVVVLALETAPPTNVSTPGPARVYELVVPPMVKFNPAAVIPPGSSVTVRNPVPLTKLARSLPELVQVYVFAPPAVADQIDVTVSHVPLPPAVCCQK